MAAPTRQDAQTPWTGYTFGRLRELALRLVGLTDSSHSGTDASLPAATTQEKTVMGDLLKEGLCEMQELFERDWPVTTQAVTAESDYTAVLLPADFGVALKHGFKVAGDEVMVLSEEDYLRTQRPDAEGGGTTLTEATGDPRYVVIRPAKQTDSGDGGSSVDDEAWRLAAWLYPVQTAAWTLTVTYRATAKALSADGDTLRLPTRLQPALFDYIAASWRERTGRTKEAADYWALYAARLKRLENVRVSEDLDLTLKQEYPHPS